MIDVLEMELKCNCKQAVISRLKAMAPDVTAFTELPKLVASNSAPTGAKAIGRNTSKRGE